MSYRSYRETLCLPDNLFDNTLLDSFIGVLWRHVLVSVERRTFLTFGHEHMLTCTLLWGKNNKCIVHVFSR